jgi:hypothetical protein
MFVIAGTLSAQNCNSGFYPFRVGAYWEQTHTDKKGKITGYGTGKITSIDPVSVGYDIGIEINSKDEKGKVQLTSNTTAECRNGTYYVQLLDVFRKMMSNNADMSDMNAVATGDVMEIPTALSVGQILSDAASKIQFNMNGLPFMTFSFLVKNRKVEAKETITTAAGTFDCFKITYDLEAKVMVKSTLKIIEWWSLGAGMVRQESYNTKGEFQGKVEITKLTR